MTLATGISVQSGISWIKKEISPRRGLLAAALVASLTASAAGLAVPMLIARMVDAFVSSSVSYALAGGIVGILVLRAVSQMSAGYWLAIVSLQAIRSVRSAMFQKLMTRRVTFHDQFDEGEKVSRVTRDVDTVVRFAVQIPITLVAGTLTFVGALVLMGTLDPLLTVLVAGLGPLSYVIVRIIGRRVRHYSHEFWAAQARASGLAQESVRMVRVIKAFLREDERRDAFDRELQSVVLHGRRRAAVMSVMGPVVQLITFAGLVLIVLLAAHWGAAELGVDELVAFILYGLLLTSPLRTAADTYGSYQSARASLDRLDDLRESEAEDDTVSDRKIEGGFRFEGVTFSYPRRETVLKDVSFEVEPGEKIALVGPNGAGKTTIGHLLLRFYEPESGAIYVDETEISEWPLRALRKGIGLVPQMSPLLHGSIRENLLLGEPTASDDELREALSRARALEFVDSLELGMDTTIGDDGVRLSGGQRQRMALARAILEDAQILILDEATSMFDPESESAFIREALDFWADRTIIIITHRPGTLKLVDRVLRVDGQKLHVDSKD